MNPFQLFLCAGAAVSALAFAGSAAAQATVKFPERVCDIRDHGAKGTRIWYDTDAFQKAIDTCASAGGGTVRVPVGRWLIGPIFMKSNVRLHLDKAASVAFATDEALYRPTKEQERFVGTTGWLSLINFEEVNNVAITGEGEFDGQGAVWWERWRADTRKAGRRGSTNRPRMVYVDKSRNVMFSGVTFLNSPSFHLVLNESENLTIDKVSIRAPDHAPNTDAIDPQDSRHVLISNNTISVGDDVVAIKSHVVDPAHPNASSADIVIRGNTFLAGRGISIGSETIGGVKRVLVENNTVDGAMYGVRIKTPRNRGGEVSEIVFRNNRFTDVVTPFVFSSYYTALQYDEAENQRIIREGGFTLNDQIYPGPGEPPQPYVPNKTPYMHGVVVDGFTATGAERVGLIIGLPEKAIEGLTFRNVNIEAKTGLRIRHADVTFERTTLKVEQGPQLLPEVKATIRGTPGR
jgi:polygalacturonase